MGRLHFASKEHRDICRAQTALHDQMLVTSSRFSRRRVKHFEVPQAVLVSQGIHRIKCILPPSSFSSIHVRPIISERSFFTRKYTTHPTRLYRFFLRVWFFSSLSAIWPITYLMVLVPLSNWLKLWTWSCTRAPMKTNLKEERVWSRSSRICVDSARSKA